jgi:anti-sigma factor RsiW
VRAATFGAAVGGAANIRPRMRAPAPWRMAAALAGVAVLSSAGTLAVTRQLAQGERAQTRAQTLIDAHVRAEAPGRMIDVASSDSHTVKPWLDARLDFAPPVSDFTAQGFPLIGGRLDYVDGRSAAVLVYGRRKHVIDVFVRPSGDAGAPPAAAERRGYHLIGWRDGGFDWWAVSDVGEAELRSLQELIERAQRPQSGA